ncbi:response regulator transcription factor [Salmonella enterica subsp. enterica serovar Augustenborg]|nr:response regulator transcription factor [Salmonella enterica subsp. enterica serovar Augustenborg]
MLILISEGLSVYEISERKHRSYKTIWTHKYNSYKKLELKMMWILLIYYIDYE